MRASNAVGLLLVSSLSIFGIYSRQQDDPSYPAGPAPVYVNGQAGVYNPFTGVFVPCTSPLFDQTCDLIMQQRQQSNGNNYNNYYTPRPGIHWSYNRASGNFETPIGGSGCSGGGSSFFGHSFGDDEGGGFSHGGFSSGSSRGGIGGMGHSFGGGHS